ncbi:hypothetical protein L6E12_00080 [Actinokineospora sp. PR83]|uniref:hypothetical protein n=1 Tax=Actinokineospora sp. PR83 TaxID=2884908 RepID=UPI0027E0B89B|nr:hypothetical protein [Actinokineospora sp. PR83]MCG8914195.1 hypothetical protein [Actinokineospora sp. PR83]
MYIDEGNNASLEQIGASMNALVGAAAAGQFAVNEHGGNALLTAIRKMLDWLERQEGLRYVLDQEPMLGASNAATVMKPYIHQVATDHQGFLTQLAALRETLVKAESAITVAMNNYRHVDEDTARRLSQQE